MKYLIDQFDKQVLRFIHTPRAPVAPKGHRIIETQPQEPYSSQPNNSVASFIALSHPLN